MLVNVCNAITEECCVFTHVACVCLLLCKGKGSSPVSAITERRAMGLYEVPLPMSLLGLGLKTMLTNFHICGIMLVLRAVFREVYPTLKVPMCFRCLMFSL